MNVFGALAVYSGQQSLEVYKLEFGLQVYMYQFLIKPLENTGKYQNSPAKQENFACDCLCAIKMLKKPLGRSFFWYIIIYVTIFPVTWLGHHGSQEGC
jgi:hypothetical protein